MHLNSISCHDAIDEGFREEVGYKFHWLIKLSCDASGHCAIETHGLCADLGLGGRKPLLQDTEPDGVRSRTAGSFCVRCDNPKYGVVFCMKMEIWKRENH